MISEHVFQSWRRRNAALALSANCARVSTVLVSMSLIAGQICAQGIDALVVGARIRVAARDTSNSGSRRQFIAIYGGVQRDSLYFQLGRDTALLALPLAEVERIDLSRSHRSAGQGALVGAGYGVLVGLGTTVALLLSYPCNDCWLSPEARALITGVPVTVLTTGLGAIIFSRRQDNWRKVQLHR